MILFRDLGRHVLSKFVKTSCTNHLRKLRPPRNTRFLSQVGDNIVHEDLKENEAYSSLLQNEDRRSDTQLSSLFKFVENPDNKDTVSEQQAILFLQSCGSKTPNHSFENSIEMLETVWKQLQSTNCKFNSAVYHTYVQVCTENRIVLNCSDFLASMKCKPDESTYKLLLQNVCENGDLEQAFGVLNLMKENMFALDEQVFNELVLVHTINGGLQGGNSVLQMMHVAHVLDSDKTKFALLRGLVIRGDEHEFRVSLQKNTLVLQEPQLTTLLWDLALSGTHMWLPEILKFAETEIFSRQFFFHVESVCAHLIHTGQPHIAIYIYKHLVKPMPEMKYAYGLMQRMLEANTPTSVIVEFAKDLKECGLNLLAFEDAAEIALKGQHVEAAWLLLEHFSYLRLHFFWPLLLDAGRKNNELGILDSLQRMCSLKVKADSETFERYCLPFCDLTDPKLLLAKIQDIGYTVKELLTPILVALLYNNNLNEAGKLCEAYNVEMQGHRVLTMLAKNWNNSDSVYSIVRILQKICESNSASVEWTGKFLIKIALSITTTNDFEKLLSTLERMHKIRLRINNTVADSLLIIISKKCTGEPLLKLQEAIEALLDVSLPEQSSVIPHLHDMNLEQLECHLLELESKNMETRGVLRKLIQMYSNLGNVEKVKDLRSTFCKRGYAESPGMKSAVMYSYVQSGNLTTALDLYHEIKSFHPKFKMDNFKVIDLTALMVAQNQFDDAVKLLEAESVKGAIQGGRAIERNCWRLLNAPKEATQVQKLFELLTTYGYCKPSNILLGPVLRIYLNSSNLQKAVDTYKECGSKYKATPLQLELTCAVLKAKDIKLLESVLATTENVHGKPAISLLMIAALAEEGMEKELKKFLVQRPLFPKKETFRKRYDRWVFERKLLPLQTIARVAAKFSIDVLDLPYLNLCLMKMYSANNDCEAAVTFWKSLTYDEFCLTKEITEVFHKLLKRCKYELPENLQIKI